MKRKGRNRTNRDNIKDRDRLTDTGGLSKADRDCYQSKANDPAWYAQNPQLLADYASFPFGAPIGTSIVPPLPLNQFQSVPGLCVLYTLPSIGAATGETSPVNIAMRNIYSYVRHANSGHSNYDAPDLMLYLLAMDSVYSYHSFLKRLLGLINVYTPLNRYYPSDLIQAMGVDPEDIRGHIADLRGYINTYAVQMGSLCVPNSMSYMARHTWMYENIYLDSATGKAQTYFYTPSSFYQFRINSTTGAGELFQARFLSPTYLTGNFGNLKKFSDLRAYGQQLLQPIITNEDMNIMSGDILKAFGENGVVKVSGVMDGYMVIPVYNPEVQSQIENATVLGGLYNEVIQQNTSVGGGYISNSATAQFTYSGLTSGDAVNPNVTEPLWQPRMVNFHMQQVSPADVMVATRLSVVLSSVNTAISSSSFVTPVLYCGSDVCECGLMWTREAPMGSTSATPLDLKAYPFSSCYWIRTYTAAAMYNVMRTLSMLESFDWAPIVQTVQIGSNGIAEFASAGMFCDIDNFTLLHPDNYRELHSTALLSEFSVPQMGSVSMSV